MINEVDYFNGKEMKSVVVGVDGVDSIKEEAGAIEIYKDGNKSTIRTPYFATVERNEKADNEHYKNDFSF
ncbi:hypothetical protein [Dellaglioa algida]|uniref:hypothetical protein n=1 Tax=Dellaglioa algida TaxID=105612 RepID=UPI0024DF06CF|nr:hypothetical protein [Dellaglioa algida]MDK1740082.1 hypothetical protein [Dellaglioa algida]